MNQSRLAEWLKLLTLLFLIIAAIAVIIVSVNFTPTAGQPGQTDAEVLAKQLEFVLKMNSAFLGFLGIIGALLTWFFKNNLEDAKEVAGQMVREEIDRRIKALIKEEFHYWEMSARTERVVGQTLVNYYLPDGAQEPPTFYLVKNRGFRETIFCRRLEEVRRLSADVVILDCQNWITSSGQSVVKLAEAEREARIKEQIDLLTALMSQHEVLVVYIHGQVKYLWNPKFQTRYVLAANNQVTLVGHTVNGAYVAFGDRSIPTSS